MYWFRSLAQEAGFHFVLEKVNRFHISNGVWGIIPDPCIDVRKPFLRVLAVVLVSGDHLLYEFRIFEISVLLLNFALRFSGHFFLRISCQTTPEKGKHRNYKQGRNSNGFLGVSEVALRTFFVCDVFLQ